LLYSVRRRSGGGTVFIIWRSNYFPLGAEEGGGPMRASNAGKGGGGIGQLDVVVLLLPSPRLLGCLPASCLPAWR